MDALRSSRTCDVIAVAWGARCLQPPFDLIIMGNKSHTDGTVPYCEYREK